MSEQRLWWCLGALAGLSVLVGVAWRSDARSRNAAVARATEQAALAQAQIITAHQAERAALEADLATAVREGTTLREQLARLQRTAPRTRNESVLRTTSGPITVPVADSAQPTPPGGTLAGTGGDSHTPAVAPVIAISVTEARLKTSAGNVAVIGETVVECVGGSCPLGWRHVEPWSVDATSLVVREQPTDPRWLVGALVGIDTDARMRYGAVAARRLGRVRDAEIHALGIGLLGDGDAVVAFGLGAAW